MGCCSARYQDTPWNSNSIGLVPGWITGLRKRNKEPTKSFHKHVDTQCRPEMGLQISGGRIAEPKRIGNRWANKTLHGHADSIAIDNSRKAETIQVSFKQWLDKENLVHPYSGILFGNKKEWSIHIHYNTDDLKTSPGQRNQVRLVKAMVFPVVMYGCESWAIKKSWAPNNRYFWTVVLEETWESLGLQGDPTSPS